MVPGVEAAPGLLGQLRSGQSIRWLLGVAVAVPSVLLLNDGWLTYQTTRQVLTERSLQGVAASHQQISRMWESGGTLLRRFNEIMPASSTLAQGVVLEGQAGHFMQAMIGNMPTAQQGMVLDEEGIVVFSKGLGAPAVGSDFSSYSAIIAAREERPGQEVVMATSTGADFQLVGAQHRIDKQGKPDGFVIVVSKPTRLLNIQFTLNPSEIEMLDVLQLANSTMATADWVKQKLRETGPNAYIEDSRLYFDPGNLGTEEPSRGLTIAQRIGSLDVFVVAQFSEATIRLIWLNVMRRHLAMAIPGLVLVLCCGLVALRQLRHGEVQARRRAETERLRRSAETAMWQANRMEAFGRLAGQMASDFRNLHAVVSGNTELLRKRVDGRGARMTDNILRATRQGEVLITQLLSFSRRHPLETKLVNLGAQLGQLHPLLANSLGRDITLSVQAGDDIWPVEVDPLELQTALLNLAINAAEAMPDGGTFHLEAMNRKVARGELDYSPGLAGDFVLVEARDNGLGMPPGVLDHAFEPFYSTKHDRQASGLGLSQVYGFAMQSGGLVQASSVVDGGTTVSLLLPRSRLMHPGNAGTEAPFPAQVMPFAAGIRILMVDDNPDVAQITAEMLRDLKYEVEVVDSGREALDRIGPNGLDVDLVIADLVMPDGIDGLELSQEARRRNPRLPILLVTGYSEAAMEAAGVATVLLKPVRQAILAEAVRDILNAPHLPRGTIVPHGRPKALPG